MSPGIPAAGLGGSSSTLGQTHRGEAAFEARAGVISGNQQWGGGKKIPPKGSLSCYSQPVPRGGCPHGLWGRTPAPKPSPKPLRARR